MVNWSIDCETYEKKEDGWYPILDATKFVLGDIYKGNGKHQQFYDKKEMWNYLIKEGKRLKNNRQRLNVYAHNHRYDFYCYADLNDKNVKIFCDSPFIASYDVDGTSIVNFLDSYALFRMSLKKLGEILKLAKLEMPEKVNQLEELKEYIERDTEICLEAIELLKRTLKWDGVDIRRFYTINQVAINYIMGQLKKHKYGQVSEFGEIYQTKGVFKKIRSAYRGGRVQAFKTGEFNNVTYIDVNSLYNFILQNMKFPQLDTYKMWKVGRDEFLDWDLEKIGITRCLILNKSNEIGILPVRTNVGNYYFKPGTYTIGTWSNQEIKLALEEGYELIQTEWTVNFEDTINPFKDILSTIYPKRKNGDFENYLYKQIPNSCIGKFAQSKHYQQYKLDNVEEAEEYLKNNWEIINAKGLDYVYKKEDSEIMRKKYYCPIIPALVTSNARLYMYNFFKSFEYDNLLYSDTDSIIFKGEIPEKIAIGQELGQFKIVQQKVPINIFGRKAYMIGDEITLGGVHKNSLGSLNKDTWRIESQQMVTLKTIKQGEVLGTFRKEERNLIDQLRNHESVEKMLKKQKIYIDKDITNIKAFAKSIEYL